MNDLKYIEELRHLKKMVIHKLDNSIYGISSGSTYMVSKNFEAIKEELDRLIIKENRAVEISELKKQGRWNKKTKGNHGGYKNNKAGVLYFIKIGENTLGYGISNNFKTRLTQHKRTFNDGGVDFEILHTIEYQDGRICEEAEALLKRNLPHNGCTLKGFKTEATALSYYNEALRLAGSVIK